MSPRPVKSAIALTGVGAIALTGVGAIALTGVGAIALTGVGAISLTVVGAISLTGVGAIALTGVGAVLLTFVGAILLTFVGANPRRTDQSQARTDTNHARTDRVSQLAPTRITLARPRQPARTDKNHACTTASASSHRRICGRIDWRGVSPGRRISIAMRTAQLSVWRAALTMTQDLPAFVVSFRYRGRNFRLIDTAGRVFQKALGFNVDSRA